MSRWPLWLVLACLALPVAWAADRVTFLTDDPYDRDVVLVTSDAPLLYMVTRTQQVRGNVEFDPDNLLDKPQARFEIDASRLNTGIALRDDHLRGPQWLDAAHFPQVTFELADIKTPAKSLALKPGATQSLDVVGRLTLHGETHDVPAVVRVTLVPASDDTAARLPGDLLQVVASFDVLLSDFGITIPPQAQAMVANRQHVEIHLGASTQRLVPKEG